MEIQPISSPHIYGEMVWLVSGMEDFIGSDESLNHTTRSDIRFIVISKYVKLDLELVNFYALSIGMLHC